MRDGATTFATGRGIVVTYGALFALQGYCYTLSKAMSSPRSDTVIGSTVPRTSQPPTSPFQMKSRTVLRRGHSKLKALLRPCMLAIED